ncbi:glycosyl hydrolase 2 galactose-binding domain-containing protein [Oryzifoliimicrobium ureilyticus]|uniref:glycosyl hydrolase 2 galactose-binding domain-containing protein n=1 Tax=Oryzifoliimicrobium ureilyticus TaxID=3113724 RepID=UPI0030760734
MRGRLAAIGADETALSEGWNLVLTEPSAYQSPQDLPVNAPFVPAFVPGTVAQALENQGQFDRQKPVPLDDRDAWYICRLFGEEAGEAILRFEGLATFCDVFLNGTQILASQSMFSRYELPVTLKGGDELALCFRALLPKLAEPGLRARWRPQMIKPQGLKNIRTTLLGRMPGWCPEIQAVGPWRPIMLVRRKDITFDDVTIRAALHEDGQATLSVSLISKSQEPLHLQCAGCTQPFERVGQDRYSAILRLNKIEPWWPNTHGAARLYDITLIAGAHQFSLGKTGFRHLAVEHGADNSDFALKINGQRIFCRGAVWTTADIVRLPGERQDYEPFLRRAAEAGMNMIRIGGTMAYETPDFFALCDELGLMVWQDFMFANFDYPAKDRGFIEHVHAEAEHFLHATQASPSLTILCGGSEVFQQAAMMGLPKEVWSGPITDEILPAISSRMRPDVPFVANSPSGGAMPFSPDAGVTHYYGVGAYMRPLEDARRANVRFAAESLAFSQVPQQITLDRHLDVPPVHHPLWKERVPRDRSASWDFEDVRDFYLQLLYGLDPQRLRREDLALYLDLSRAVTGEVLEECFAEWRRPASGCNGALVWTLQDLLPGAGWGVIDSTGEPKPVWYAMHRAFRPLQILLSDEGTNGLDLHVLNETREVAAVEVELSCLRNGRQRVNHASQALALQPRSSHSFACTDLFGGFFDTNYAFRFGPLSHDVVVARLKNADGTVLAEAFHFPAGRAKLMGPSNIEATLLGEKDGLAVSLSTDSFAQSVHLMIPGYRPADDWFHLAPGTSKLVRLTPLSERHQEEVIEGHVSALGGPVINIRKA